MNIKKIQRFTKNIPAYNRQKRIIKNPKNGSTKLKTASYKKLKNRQQNPKRKPTTIHNKLSKILYIISKPALDKPHPVMIGLH